jgi:deoxyribodipyrimidine photolyase
MDIHKNFIQAAAMDKEGTIIKEQQFKSDGEAIKRFINSLKTKNIQAAIEATCTWYHVYETLDALGIETILVNMRRTKTIAESKIKTDKLDAKTIAQCLRTGFIATAYIPPKTILEQRTILRHRMSLRKEITRYKNKIHAILLRNGQPTSHAAHQHPWNQLLQRHDHPDRDRRNTPISPSEEALQLCRARTTNHPIRKSCLPGENLKRMQSEPKVDLRSMHPYPYPMLPEQLDNQTLSPRGEQERNK